MVFFLILHFGRQANGGALAPHFRPLWLRYCQTWSPRGRFWPRGHILKFLASKVKFLALASKLQIFENCPDLVSRTALFFEPLKFCWKTPETLRKIWENLYCFPQLEMAWKRFKTFFFRKHLRLSPWSREGLSSEGLSLASDFFVSLASSLVSSTAPLLSILFFFVRLVSSNDVIPKWWHPGRGRPFSDTTGLEGLCNYDILFVWRCCILTRNNYTPAVHRAPESHINQWAKWPIAQGPARFWSVQGQGPNTRKSSPFHTRRTFFYLFRSKLFCTAEFWVPLNVEMLVAPLLISSLDSRSHL